MKNLLFASGALGALLCAACNLDQSGESGKQYLSLRVEDSLSRYDRVAITLISPEGDTLEKVWDGPLPDVSRLERVETAKYRGGDIDVLIEAEKGDEIAYLRLVHYEGGSRTARIDTLPLPDYAAPTISLLGQDTVRVILGEGAFRDSAVCTDNRDSHPRLEVNGEVKTGTLGTYVLFYACKDSAGNQATARLRVVIVEQAGDDRGPEISLGGPANLSIPKGGAYIETATCKDDRDPDPRLITTGKVNPDSVGSYFLDYACLDSSGNPAAPKLRVVEVTEGPDVQPPVIVLNAESEWTMLKGSFYVEKAFCTDNRDPKPRLTVSGKVNTDSLGTYVLTYACEDSAGNAALARTRTVRVVRDARGFPPILTLAGPSLLTLSVGEAFSDPAAACVNGVGDSLPVAASGKVLTDKVGVYLRLYSCTDGAGQTITGSRQIVVEEPSTVLPAIKEAGLDTNYRFNLNNGSDPSPGFSFTHGDDWITIFQFDLSRVRKEGLVSAKAVFKSYGLNSHGAWNGQTIQAVAHVSRLTHPFTEGNGNWYYHDGAWANGGQVYFANYTLRPEILRNSVDPAFAEGVNSNDLSEFRPENLIPIGEGQPVPLRFTQAQSAFPGTKPIPPPESLVDVEIDLTEYVKTSPGENDYGLLITLDEMQGMQMRFLAKEAGDGSLGPKLYLQY